MPTLEHPQLLTAVQHILLDEQQGISEFALIQRLKQQQHPLFISVDLSDTLSLFRTHFILFHSLYVLRDSLRAAGTYDVLINPLRIQLQPALTTPAAGQKALNTSDPLRAYYLDLEHLARTDRDAVEQLLYRGINQLSQPQAVTDALAELELQRPAHKLKPQQVKQQYRQLVSRHHPDRGGCTERLQRINQAMATLREYHLLG